MHDAMRCAEDRYMRRERARMIGGICKIDTTIDGQLPKNKQMWYLGAEKCALAFLNRRLLLESSKTPAGVALPKKNQMMSRGYFSPPRLISLHILSP